MRPNFSLRQLRHFLTLAEIRSFAGASREINLSTPALHESIRTLERELGVELFKRNKQKIDLTNAGFVFVEHAQAVLNAAMKANLSINEAEQEDHGEFVIGATTSVTGYFLPPLMARFQNLYPHVLVKVIEDKRDYLEHLLLNGEIDVALLLGDSVEYPHSFASFTLLSSPWRVWLPDQHPLCAYRALSLAQLVDERWILLKSNELEKRLTHIQRSIQSNSPNWADWQDRSIRTETFEAVRSLVASSQGISLLPSYLFRAWSLEGLRLDSRPLLDLELSESVNLFWRDGSKLSPHVQRFIKIAQN